METVILVKKILLKKINSGQTFIEFILLLAVIMILSTSLLKGINYLTTERWRGITALITSPDPDKLNFPDFP